MHQPSSEALAHKYVRSHLRELTENRLGSSEFLYENDQAFAGACDTQDWGMTDEILDDFERQVSVVQDRLIEELENDGLLDIFDEKV